MCPPHTIASPLGLARTGPVRHDVVRLSVLLWPAPPARVKPVATRSVWESHRGASHDCQDAMRAIVQEGYGSADVLKLREIALPIVADDGVLVRVHAASVNALDSHLVYSLLPGRGLLGPPSPRRAVRGVDVAGTVETVGRSVTRFKPGDEVFGVAPGAFAEYASTTQDRLAAKSPRLTFQQAAALPVAGVTALQGLRDKAGVQPGQRVLVHGAGGGVGTFAVQIAKALGAHVTAVTGPRNLEVVRSLGPDRVIDYSREDFARLGERFDVFFDVAATRPIRECLDVLVPKGAFVVVGAAKGGLTALFGRLLALLAIWPFTSRRILWFIARVRSHDLVTLQELFEAGKLTACIDREYALDEVPDAIRYVHSGQGRAKVVIGTFLP
jgi:NADPH:quinone reductase-like Zn-dependent oxidoreductase